MSDERMPKPDPKVDKIEFPPVTIYAHCWCDTCGWELHPTGWYDTDGPITLDELVSVWQQEHDGLLHRLQTQNPCKATIAWRELQ